MTALRYLIVFVILAVVILEIDAVFLPRRLDFNLKDKVVSPKKRPFCNAFTGCGRKRSNLPALTDQGDVIEDSIGSLLELNAEPAIEDLSRQIMSEAKLWETIQEANLELNRRKHQQQQQSSIENSDEDVGVPAKSATATCALPPCYI